MHPEIIRLGFIEYVDAIARQGYPLVFPDLRSPTSSSPLGDRLYDEFMRGLPRVIPDAKECKKVMHSIRKSFGNHLKQQRVASEIRGDIMGHGGKNTTEEIYCDPIALASMLEELMKLPIVTDHFGIAGKFSSCPGSRKKQTPPWSRPSTQGSNAVKRSHHRNPQT